MASYKNALDRLMKEAYLEEELRKLVDDANTDLASDKSIACSLRKIYKNGISYYHIIFTGYGIDIGLGPKIETPISFRVELNKIVLGSTTGNIIVKIPSVLTNIKESAINNEKHRLEIIKNEFFTKYGDRIDKMIEEYNKMLEES